MTVKQYSRLLGNNFSILTDIFTNIENKNESTILSNSSFTGNKISNHHLSFVSWLRLRSLLAVTTIFTYGKGIKTQVV